MISTFSWLDYSEKERRRVVEVIKAFEEPDTRDELGIGAVRDGFADLFFPGTSTIQTRAKYFFFVPWVYLQLERQKVPSSEIARKARQHEISLIDALCKSGEKDGVIGIEARSTLKRLPSNIYWQGLATWGIRLYPGSQDQYHRSIGAFYQSKQEQPRNDDGEPIDGSISRNWHAPLPHAPGGFPDQSTFRLKPTEAEYLRERIMARLPGTLLAFLVDRGHKSDPVDFPWEHPQHAEFPARCREQLEHARNFSEMIHGAQLLYNLLLAEKTADKEKLGSYTKRLEEWFTRIRTRSTAFDSWDRRQFWDVVVSGGARVTLLTQSFINTWLDLASGLTSAATLIKDDHARRLICERELALKRDQARLQNPRALELWSGAAGTAQLNYRWRIAQTIVGDILEGLLRDKTNA
ncbi:MAG: DUF6361 family protein [Acidobacteriia bacterium]|nr:DUF6361 family protein [Terriglobia bacterium]